MTNIEDSSSTSKYQQRLKLKPGFVRLSDGKIIKIDEAEKQSRKEVSPAKKKQTKPARRDILIALRNEASKLESLKKQANELELKMARLRDSHEKKVGLLRQSLQLKQAALNLRYDNEVDQMSSDLRTALNSLGAELGGINSSLKRYGKKAETTPLAADTQTVSVSFQKTQTNAKVTDKSVLPLPVGKVPTVIKLPIVPRITESSFHGARSYVTKPEFSAEGREIVEKKSITCEGDEKCIIVLVYDKTGNSKKLLSRNMKLNPKCTTHNIGKKF